VKDCHPLMKEKGVDEVVVCPTDLVGEVADPVDVEG
jgi:hypothetical protein